MATPVSAHHSDAVYDTAALTTLEGTVTRYEFRNPHTYIQIETLDAEGVRVTNIEAGSISWLGPLGLARDSLQVGDPVTVRAYPSRRSADVMLGREIVKQDGTVVPLNASSPYIERSGSTGAATDIAGTWVMEEGATDRMQESQREWQLTDAATAALAAPRSRTPQARCIPMSVPNLMLYPVVTLIDIDDDAVRMRIDWMDSERIIYTDGRGHPGAEERFLHGHSVGRWEGEGHTLLVVETTNFADHAVGTGYGIPSGSGKRVVERFELSDDGSQIAYRGIIESPEYLAEPATWSFAFDNRPDLSHSERGCDLESAGRFEAE
jgi:hypothetical protein